MSVFEDFFFIRLKQRDRDAFELLYDTYSGILLGAICKQVGDIDFANQILEKAFLNMWEALPFYDQPLCSMLTWMLQIARDETVKSLCQRDVVIGQEVNSQFSRLTITRDVVKRMLQFPV